MLLETLLPHMLPHCNPHGVRAVPKGCRGKLWQFRGGLFVGVEHALHGVGGEGMSVVGVERKSGASLFEKGKWETAYQFQEVVVNATKFGQDCIKKPVHPTGKCTHETIAHNCVLKQRRGVRFWCEDEYSYSRTDLYVSKNSQPKLLARG